MAEFFRNLHEQFRTLLRMLGARFVVAGAIGLTAVLTVLIVFFFFTSHIGEAQPIPFSHRFHVGTKNLSCVFCHSGVLKTERAGVPPIEARASNNGAFPAGLVFVKASSMG